MIHILKVEIKLITGSSKNFDVVGMNEDCIHTQIEENEWLRLFLKGGTIILRCSDIKEVIIKF